MNKRLTITEEEKNEILFKYGIINNNITSQEPTITITEISSDSPIVKKILLEKKDDNKIFYDNEGNVVNINLVKRELLKYFKSYYNLPSTNPTFFCGKFNIKGDKCLFKFRLENEHNIRDHFVERIYRVTSGDYKIGEKKYNENLINPSKFEGFNLFFDNIDLIISKIVDSNTPIKGGRESWSKSRNKSFYIIKVDNLFSVIFELNKDSYEDKMYNVIFITQLKGEEMFNTPELLKSIKIIV
jgi:hypothetical protein